MTNKTGSSIWITGCAGFLGKRLAAHLVPLGHSVVGLSRRQCSIAGTSVAIDLAADDAPEKLSDLIRDLGVPDAVVHAASRQPGSGTVPDFIRSNVQATANLLEAFKQLEGFRQKAPQIIYTSTHSVYCRPDSLPVREEDRIGGKMPYGLTKRWAEQLMESIQKSFQVVILRLPSLYGVGQDDSFVDGLAKLAVRGAPLELFSRGDLIRDALHVSDAIGAITSCLKRPPDKSLRVMNLGCGRPIKTYQYAHALVRALESKSEIVPVHRPASHFDLYAEIELARRSIGFKPMTLEESMRVYANELRT
jgi:nucleoside-diphosphate-sugar epimerase